jgi:hypothetical protein
MAKKIKLSQREHPLYAENSSKWTMYLNSVLGGSDFINEDYLFSHQLEDTEYYEERLDRAYYLNFCDTIPKLYNSFIFRSEVQRPPSPDLELFRSNADGRNTKISEFVKRCGYFSSIFGAIHALVDVPSNGGKSMSKAEAATRGIYPYASIIFPSQLKDWSLDRFGNFKWIVVEGEHFNDSDPDTERESNTYYKLITTDEWRVEDSEGQPFTYDDKTPNKGKNLLGIVPLATMYHTDVNDDKIGESLIKDIIYVNRTILNWCSCIDEQIERQTFSQLIVPDNGTLAEESETNDDPLHKLGTSNIWTFPHDASHPPAYISPDTENINTIWKLVVDHIKEIYRMAGLLGGASDLYTSRSGRQSQFSFIGVNSSLAEKSSKYEKFENDLSRLALMQQNKNATDYESVKYPSNFDVVSLSEEVDSLFSILERNFSPTLNKTLMKDIARRSVSYAPPIIRKQIEDEIETGDGLVDGSVSKLKIQPEKNGQGNTNTNLNKTFKTSSDVEEEEVQKKKVKE